VRTRRDSGWTASRGERRKKAEGVEAVRGEEEGVERRGAQEAAEPAGNGGDGK